MYPHRSKFDKNTNSQTLSKLDGEGFAISDLALRIVKDLGRYDSAIPLFEILSALKPLK
jgi:hypothetical protein